MRRIALCCLLAMACNSGSNEPTDTDGDGISDEAEGRDSGIDTDDDGVQDFEDEDSDADGFPDSEEAGDTDLTTPPVDTDGDGVPDFRDPDSDDDGLSDSAEREAGTSRTLGDTDGDGADDLVEVGVGTDPLESDDNPGARGDVVFLLPWMLAPEPASATIPFQTYIQKADVYFLFDKSGSMQDEVDAIRDAVVAMLGDFTCAASEDPAMRTCVPDIYSGDGQYHDPYNNLLSLQADHAATSTSIDTISAEDSISKEDFFEAVTCLANGSCGTGCTPPVGCAGFRQDAVRMALVFSDEDSDDGTLEAAAGALNDAAIRFVGIWNNAAATGRGDMENLALSTGAVRADGTTLLVFDGVDDDAATAATDGIRAAIEEAPLRVTIAAEDEAGDDGDALPFVESLEINTSGSGDCTVVSLTEDSDFDGRADTFPMLQPGTSVCWDLTPATNGLIEPTDTPQVFTARLAARGNESPLDDRRVFFLVPPDIPGQP